MLSNNILYNTYIHITVFQTIFTSCFLRVKLRIQNSKELEMQCKNVI